MKGELISRSAGFLWRDSELFQYLPISDYRDILDSQGVPWKRATYPKQGYLWQVCFLSPIPPQKSPPFGSARSDRCSAVVFVLGLFLLLFLFDLFVQVFNPFKMLRKRVRNLFKQNRRSLWRWFGKPRSMVPWQRLFKEGSTTSQIMLLKKNKDILGPRMVWKSIIYGQQGKSYGPKRSGMKLA